jgi:hypothetical protein
LHYGKRMFGPPAFPLPLTEPLTRSLQPADPEPCEPEQPVRLTRDLTRSLYRELWHRHDELAIDPPGDPDESQERKP